MKAWNLELEFEVSRLGGAGLRVARILRRPRLLGSIGLSVSGLGSVRGQLISVWQALGIRGRPQMARVLAALCRNLIKKAWVFIRAPSCQGAGLGPLPPGSGTCSDDPSWDPSALAGACPRGLRTHSPPRRPVPWPAVAARHSAARARRRPNLP